MKKAIAMFLTLALAGATLAACGGNSNSASSAASNAASAAESAVSEAASAAEEAVSEAVSQAESAVSEAVSEAESAVSEAVSEATEQAGDAVTDAAMAYFANFPDNRNAISTADLFEKMDAGEDMLILDIRQADAYGEGHLKGAVNVPYQNIPSMLEQIPDDVPVYVNCYTGQTSSQTTALLNMAGKYAVNIQSGWNRGISQTEGYEDYTETEANELPGGTYEVDEDIAEALTDYYDAAFNDADHQYFNFPVDELAGLVEAGDDSYTILSVRQADDYNEGHIEGAINIPYGKGMQESFSEIPTDKPVVVYCYTGQTASQTMAILRMLGFEAYNLNGGMGNDQFGWLSEGNPVVASE